MTLHLGLPSTRHQQNSEQQQEVREARRLLRERIRNDWDYPTLPAYTSCGRSSSNNAPIGCQEGEEEDANVSMTDRIAGFRFHTPGTHHLDHRRRDGSGEALGLEFDPVDWRERQYSSESDTEMDEASATETTNPSTRKEKNSGSTYKFEDPESVGTQLKDRRLAKKRKRFRAMEEEMEWNDGLSHWMRRRDAWCCARTATEVHISGDDDNTNTNSPTTQEGTQTSTSASASPSTTTSSPRSSTSSTTQPNQHTTTTSTPSSSLATTPSSLPLPTLQQNHTIISPLEVLVPIAPSMLPNHPVRRKITPPMYPEIYTKIILQSRTPSVPINLQALVNALVQGWKDDGEWPPKSAPLEKSIGRKKGSQHGLREGVKAVGRVLRITGGHDSNKGNG